MNTQQLETMLCQTLCANTAVVAREDGCWRVSTPFVFPDGDAYTLYLKTLPTGGLRISDMGSTLMHLSYENDIDKFREGSRGRLFGQVLAEMELNEEDGEFFIDTPTQDLGYNLLRFGQGLTRIHDLTFLNRLRVESTFYEDLREKLNSYIDPENIEEQYTVEGVANAGDYPVDYYIKGGRQPLYLFGVPNRDKARLATIVLQHLNGSGVNFDSMIVFQNMADIPARDLSRLTNAANDMIDSLDATVDFERKLLRKVR